MRVNLALLFGILLGIMLVSVSGRQIALDDTDDNALYLSKSKARSFLDALESDDDIDFQRRQQPQCVRCKFGLGKCCLPNFCRKKHFLPNECIEVKTGK
ncbi:unnamed protein product [Didymodactylos carnosus]|uniref:Uncharacterized protein n=1 Tax=Didymodactylos carnosus TaxID=1234261 RepID=A0A815WUS7_9BILA|nr:unnamed protein product [Didymodactylos carnosus]CAF1548873.1 unnamed protein product [Didymodactylos carnosus]CAF3768177.1 unnamed protein product [Didymodactylos carnosus]CAF4409760.1 unnamed protein product [Didymodactylos carnosus]